jgi:hypothetical protein
MGSISMPDPVRAFVAELQSQQCEVFLPEALVARRRLAQAHATVDSKPRDFIGKEIVLGRLGGGHIGDTVCTSSLPRRLVERFGSRVFVSAHRCAVEVFQNNPFVTAFVKRRGIQLGRLAMGAGHVIQRLELALGLQASMWPAGDLHLTAEEWSWARAARAGASVGGPVAVLSSGCLSVSDWGRSRLGSWGTIATVLARHFTVIQVAVGKVSTLRQAVKVSHLDAEKWVPDSALPSCRVIWDLPFRLFVALIAIADVFVGPNSGGAHLAAALRIPSVVVLDRTKYERDALFQRKGPRWRKEDFLYPQHVLAIV